MAAEQLTLCIWESEITHSGPGAVTLTARRPLSTISTKRAALILGCTEWTVRDLYRQGFLSGYKPGARVARADGKASNATLVLDCGSVLEYKARQGALAAYERRR